MIYAGNREVKEIWAGGRPAVQAWAGGTPVWGGEPAPTPEWWGLKFTAQEPGAVVSMMKVNDPPAVSLLYSTDNGSSWSDFTVGTTSVSLPAAGDSVCFKAGAGGNATFAFSEIYYNKFTSNGMKFAASGSAMSLLSGDAPTYAIS